MSKNKKSIKKSPRTSRYLLLFAVVFGAFGAFYLWRVRAATACTVSAKLVNSCRPWLGAAADNYPGTGGAGGLKTDILAHESRIGRQLDVVHNYRAAGQVLSNDDKYFINRPNMLLMENWKPSNTWREADGRNATVNAQIDAMADSIKSVAPKKLFLVIFHEPENDMSPGGAPGCPDLPYKGNSGTTADYVNMWRNVRSRFDAKGVNNVVWVMNYMGYVAWDCAVKQLWPGNDYVDWVVWDPYVQGSLTFNSVIDRFYNWLSANSDSTHNFLSKTWGINEWGVETNNQNKAYQAYKDAKTALETNRYPKIKLWNVWDNSFTAPGDYQIQYAQNGSLDQTEQNHYNAFANSPYFTDQHYEPEPEPEPEPDPPDESPPDDPSDETDDPPKNTGGTSSPPGQSGSSADDASSEKNDPPVVTGNLTVTSEEGPVRLNGKPIDGTTIDTTRLPDGIHTITTVEDGKAVTRTIKVDNPLPRQILNHVIAYPIRYTIGGVAGIIMISAGWIYRAPLLHRLALSRLKGLLVHRF